MNSLFTLFINILFIYINAIYTFYAHYNNLSLSFVFYLTIEHVKMTLTYSQKVGGNSSKKADELNILSVDNIMDSPSSHSRIWQLYCIL